MYFLYKVDQASIAIFKSFVYEILYNLLKDVFSIFVNNISNIFFQTYQLYLFYNLYQIYNTDAFNSSPTYTS